LPHLDILIVPIGGGGLASGVGVAIKSAVPQVRIIGVETAASTPFAISRSQGRITRIEARESLADGLTGNLEPGSMTFELVERVVDDLVMVDERELGAAVRGLAAEEHLIAEGAGAAATAAAMFKSLVAKDQTAAVIVSGANIDIGTFASILRG
jgi:threonine dehydratase